MILFLRSGGSVVEQRSLSNSRSARASIHQSCRQQSATESRSPAPQRALARENILAAERGMTVGQELRRASNSRSLGYSAEIRRARESLTSLVAIVRQIANVPGQSSL